MSEEQIKDMILKQCLELTTNNDFRPPISAYNGVDIDDVVRVYKQLQDKKTYIDLVKENARLKDKFKDLEEWLEAMVSMYEDEYKDVDASEHYKCMLYKLKEN